MGIIVIEQDKAKKGAGMKVFRNEHLVEFYRKPRSKKKRIIAKWEKRPRNYRPDINHVYWSNGCCIALTEQAHRDAGKGTQIYRNPAERSE